MRLNNIYKHIITFSVFVIIALLFASSLRYKYLYEKTLCERDSVLQADKLSFYNIHYNKYNFIFDKPDYQNLYPDFYAPCTLNITKAPDKTVYLTFDDGPSARTYEILDILDEYDVKATFFVVGKTDDFSMQAMRDIAARGHTIAMHSYSHEYKEIYSSVPAFIEDMYKIFTLIKDTTGVTPSYFRFAGGSINSYNYDIYQEIVSEMLRRNFIPCDWNVSSEDASRIIPPAEKIADNVLSGSIKTNRAIVLMHDSAPHTSTVQALPEVIETLKENGYSFDKLTPETKPVLFSYVY